ncbi:MAG: hypothetical protein ABIC68_01085 [Candidatus Omnitrophota bacterium]
MATIKGLKPIMDDWISADIFSQYQKACKRYGLSLWPDTVFNTVQKDTELKSIDGKNRLTSTKAFGKPFEKHKHTDSIHVFISRSKNRLQEGVKNGWYPLAIKGKIIEKPLIDVYKFGNNLGYPPCCIDFFNQHNNWLEYSFYYEILKNTRRGKKHLFTNPFLKDDTYSYIFHMPCSFRCKKTISHVNDIRTALLEEDRDFVQEIDKYLQFPFLVFRERKAYIFEGKIKNNKLFYDALHYVGQMPSCNTYEKELKMGDTLFIENYDVIILKKGHLVKKISCRNSRPVPEPPFLIQFDRY